MGYAIRSVVAHDAPSVGSISQTNQAEREDRNRLPLITQFFQKETEKQISLKGHGGI